MLRTKITAIIVAAMACSTASAQIVNGDFSAYTVTPTNGPQGYIDVNSTNIGLVIPGWSYLGGNDSDNVALTAVNYLDQTQQEVDVSGGADTFPAGIGQSVATTFGKTYTLTFDIFTGSPDHVGGVDLLVNNGALGSNGTVLETAANLQGSTSAVTNYLQAYSYTFTADSNLTSVSFLMPATGLSKPVSQVADVQMTPEPFTMALSAAAVGLAVRRKLRKAA